MKDIKTRAIKVDNTGNELVNMFTGVFFLNVFEPSW